MRDAEMTALLRQLALDAGAAIMAVRASGDLDAVAKADDSPLTRADLAADDIILAGLRAAYPDLPVVTEENAASHVAVAGLHFLVDPLDGTKEFLRGAPDFTVNIALIENGAPVAGVVHAPAQGALWRTDAEGGAAQEKRGVAQAIRAARADTAALRVVASRSHRDAETDAFIARLMVSEIKSAGSSLKFCLVAMGEADLYPRFGRTMEWDTAAGHAVLAAAGGDVIRLADGEPLRYGKMDKANPGFVARGAGAPMPS